MMEWLDVLKEMVDDALEAQHEKETDGSKHPWTKAVRSHKQSMVACDA